MRFGIREAIFFIVLLAVPAVSLFYVFQPRNEEIQQALKEIAVKQERLDQLNRMKERIDDIGLKIEEGKELIGFIEEKLPSEQEVHVILRRVSEMAKQNRQTVKSVKSEKPVPAAMYMELPLKMVIEGDFDGFYQFLLELENLQRITRIHQLKLERAGIGSGPQPVDAMDGSMKAEFTLSIYFETGADESA
jgi:type IV pilus assembly protein PilO